MVSARAHAQTYCGSLQTKLQGDSDSVFESKIKDEFGCEPFFMKLF
jgi:hypothetical protein